MKQMKEENGVAMRYFNAWTRKDFNLAGSLLSEYAKFDMPINTYRSKQEFMAAVQFTANALTSITLHAAFEGRGQAIMLYDIALPGVGVMRIAEFFKLEEDRITEIWHIHDTHPLRNTAFNKE